METTGVFPWFEGSLAELGFELWIGDPAEIIAKRVRKQKYDREDARLLIRLMTFFAFSPLLLFTEVITLLEKLVFTRLSVPSISAD